jgi:outer membrane protein OmpA-like peptidoglycan-associated protein
MLKLFKILSIALVLVGLHDAAIGQEIDALKPKPLVAKGSQRPFKAGAEKNISGLAWGGDNATIWGTQNKHIDGTVAIRNNIQEQVDLILAGETPWFRGTIDMYIPAAAALAEAGLELELVYQLTWSTGDDVFVVRKDIKGIQDLRGKTIVTQLYGPHLALIVTALKNAGMTLDDVKIVFVENLTISENGGDKVTDPFTAMELLPEVAAATVIFPDWLTLSMEAEGIGAKNLFDTQIANKVIADCYWVVKSFREKNPGVVEKFVNQNLKATEAFTDLLATKNFDSPEDVAADPQLKELLTQAAADMFDDPGALDLPGGMLLGGCTWAKFDGNYGFLTGKKVNGEVDLRDFKTLVDELMTAHLKLGYIRKPFTPLVAPLDFSALSKGLKYANSFSIETKVSEAERNATQSKLEARAIAAVKEREEELDDIDLDAAEIDLELDGTLFNVPVKFATTRSSFSSSEYFEDYDRILGMYSTYQGAVLEIIGHTDPAAYNIAMKSGDRRRANLVMRAAQELSMQRAYAVRDSFIEYAKSKGVTIDPELIYVQAMGITAPIVPRPKTGADQQKNRRCDFRIVNLVGVEVDL